NKNRRYKIFNINLRNSEYNSVDFSCDCKKRQPYLTASFYEDIVLLQNCNDKLSLYDRLNGKMIKELSIDYDSILLNEKIDILKYSYLHDFKGESKRPEYRYLKGDDRKMIKYSDPSFYFVEDSIITYLKIKTFYTINSSSGSYCYARAFLPFDFSRKMILYGQASQNLKFNDYTIYHINKLSKSKIIVSGYFYGFHGEILFGYFPNKTKQFIIEKME
ncbi:MAG: hypothetical protein GXO89_13880, partial [Chlorobi bacterium]|nr:hypothetical protein [Chlorobiota bacterium]